METNQPSVDPVGAQGKAGGLKVIALLIFLGGLAAALQGLAILIVASSRRVSSNATGMMIVKWILAALLIIIAVDVYRTTAGIYRKKTRIMAGILGGILLLLFVLKYGEMLSQLKALQNASFSFLLKIPDYAFVIIFPFTVLACLLVPFVLKKAVRPSQSPAAGGFSSGRG